MINRSTDLKTIEIPHEPGQSVVIARLNRKHMRRAAEARQASAIGKLKSLGGAAFIREMSELQSLPVSPVEGAPVPAPDVLDQFDEDTLLELGVKAWSYRDTNTGEPIPVNQESLDELDDVTAPFIARAIVAYHRGDEAIAKND